ncbi:phosphoglycerate mutase family protein [Toxoplasma gondii ME49]|uniref:Phosphoglycerate mutase family protein n=1 Tax=Toxoplasma gondii (strain ATCC 50611 / Me49) TaxID=508771 RepID=S8GIY4_TOXGM|nr:phosphoglycerate mutase family protein [Toxoplasma gondii ME49]EPT28469.1 phosphoglycerate mutase family protein [Toxoplasma gondii ME49]|eukprot:XP_018636631.1 phosphoglycerate mutase family protein [Toxoplasma gondii ME49]
MEQQRTSSVGGDSLHSPLSPPSPCGGDHGEKAIYLHLIRHAEGTHNRGAKERKPGQSRTSIFRSPDHFDARLSARGRTQCAEAGTQMPASLRKAMAARLREDESRHHERLEQATPTVDKTSDATDKTTGKTPEKLGEKMEQQTAETAEAEGERERGAVRRSGEDEDREEGRWKVKMERTSVVLCTSTLRRALETGHLVVQRAIEDLRKKAEQTQERPGEVGGFKAEETLESEEASLVRQTIPTFALEDLREWSGGGHICDGRHSTRELRQFCAPRFTNLTFVVDKDEDALPPSMPRESRADVERRCVSFLNFVLSLASQPSPSACASSSSSPSGSSSRQSVTTGKCGHSSSPPSPPSSPSPSSSSPLHVMCVVHSAWTRHLLSVLGLFDPSTRGLRNCEWRSITTSVEKLRSTLQKIACASSSSRLPFSPPSGFPLSLPASSSGASLTLPWVESSPESSDVIGERRTVASLSDFLDAVPENPFSLLIFPPTAAMNALSKDECDACTDPSASSPACLRLALKRAENAILDWCAKYQYVSGVVKKRRTHDGGQAAESACVEDGEEKHTEAGESTLEERRTRLEDVIERMRLLDSEEGRRTEVVTDATICLRPVNEDTQNDRWEVVAKERVHRQTCLLVVLPRALRTKGDAGDNVEQNEKGNAASAPSAEEGAVNGASPVLESPLRESREEEEKAERDRDEEIYEICSKILPSTSGVEAVHRLDVLCL